MTGIEISYKQGPMTILIEPGKGTQTGYLRLWGCDKCSERFNHWGEIRRHKQEVHSY